MKLRQQSSLEQDAHPFLSCTGNTCVCWCVLVCVGVLVCVTQLLGFCRNFILEGSSKRLSVCGDVPRWLFRAEGRRRLGRVKLGPPSQLAWIPDGRRLGERAVLFPAGKAFSALLCSATVCKLAATWAGLLHRSIFEQMDLLEAHPGGSVSFQKAVSLQI
jgi:hypothetical protein